jgi:type II secretory pathway pseudopilin PulG
MEAAAQPVAQHGIAGPRVPGRGPRPAHVRGITLLELLIILAVIFVVLFIALPTLEPSEEEAVIERAKEHLLYLHSKEQRYFDVHGEYAPLPEVAADASAGAGFDPRFAKDSPQVDGIKFTGPHTKSRIYDIIAELPDGTRYRIDQTGVVKTMQ